MATPHIESNKEDIAKIVLMPGDPKRALYIAENFLTDYKLVNNVRGMTAYTGKYKGRIITVFPSGMGNPSMGIYSYELFSEYNVDVIIRIGTVGAYKEELKVGDVLLIDNSVSNSSFAKVQSNFDDNKISSNRFLNDVIDSCAKELNVKVVRGDIFCCDVFYEQNADFRDYVNKYNVMGVEMESFALFHTASILNKKATALVTVSNSFCNSYELTSEERETKLNEMITLALESSLKL